MKKYKLKDGTSASKSELLEMVAKGREPILNGKDTWLVCDSWINARDAKFELWDFYRFLLKQDDKKFSVTEVESAGDLVEDITGVDIKSLSDVYLPKKKQSRTFRVDNGRMWIIGMKE